MSGGRRRPRGLTIGAGWEVGARRTLPISAGEAWALLTSPEGLACWLGEAPGLAFARGSAATLPDGTAVELTVVAEGSHVRLAWRPPGWPRPSIVQVRVLARGGGATLAFHQEHLPDEEAREERRAAFAAALDRLERLATNRRP